MRRRDVLTSTAAIALSGLMPLPALAQGRHHATGYLRTNWSRDRYAYGSYSYIARLGLLRDNTTLAAPVNDQIFFAGEATHPDYQSTVHAALESGQLAVEAIAETDAERIAVIGAGVAGLTAATLLDEDDYDVTVFEARDRIGGRVWTDRSLGIPLDLGASWIHGHRGNPVAELADEWGVATVETEETAVIRGGDGRLIAPEDQPEWLADVLEMENDAGVGRADLHVSRYRLADDYAGEDLMFPGGYDQILDTTVEFLDIRLRSEITHVVQTENGVRLTDQRGQQSDFDAVIVTVPLGVLKAGAITFDPPLPEPKRAAIARLGMGVLDKLCLQFDAVFWDADATWLITPENNLPRGQYNQWLNLAKYIDAPVLVGFAGGAPALDLAVLSDEEVLRRALQTLVGAYPS